MNNVAALPKAARDRSRCVWSITDEAVLLSLPAGWFQKDWDWDWNCDGDPASGGQPSPAQHARPNATWRWPGPNAGTRWGGGFRVRPRLAEAQLTGAPVKLLWVRGAGRVIGFALCSSAPRFTSPLSLRLRYAPNPACLARSAQLWFLLKQSNGTAPGDDIVAAHHPRRNMLKSAI